MPQWSRAFLSLSGLLLLLGLTACGKSEPAPEPERYVRTLVLSAQNAGLVREYAAEVRARTESRLSFRVGGKLLERRVDLGAVVRPGQLLASLDGQDLNLAQESAKAALLAARVNRDQLAADYKRYIDLKAQGFISAAELERRENAFKAAQAQYEQARAQAEVQRNQAGYAQLLADAAGVVTAVEAEPGMVVAAGTPIVRVAHDGPRDIVFSVPEDQVAQLRSAAAQPEGLKVRLWGDAKAPVAIRLRELAASADPVTRTFLAKGELKGQEVRLGQTATVILSSSQGQGVIKLPLGAVLEDKGRSVVWLLDGQSMTVKPHPIQVLAAEGNELIVQGLQAGQEVVSAGVHVLNAGQKVKRYKPASTQS
jgi:RND family efflux transporter MFP subunit